MENIYNNLILNLKSNKLTVLDYYMIIINYFVFIRQSVLQYRDNIYLR